MSSLGFRAGEASWPPLPSAECSDKTEEDGKSVVSPDRRSSSPRLLQCEQAGKKNYTGEGTLSRKGPQGSLMLHSQCRTGAELAHLITLPAEHSKLRNPAEAPAPAVPECSARQAVSWGCAKPSAASSSLKSSDTQGAAAHVDDTRICCSSRAAARRSALSWKEVKPWAVSQAAIMFSRRFVLLRKRFTGVLRSQGSPKQSQALHHPVLQRRGHMQRLLSRHALEAAGPFPLL